MNKFKTLLIFLAFVSTFFCQGKIELIKLSNVELLNIEDSIKHEQIIGNISSFKLVIFRRKNETFGNEDLINRDYFYLENQRIFLDSLVGLKQNNYTGSYDLIDSYQYNDQKDLFYIFSFVDNFIFGTNQQVYFVLFKKYGNTLKYYSSYENKHNESMESISIVKNGKKMKLIGKYLKKIRI